MTLAGADELRQDLDERYADLMPTPPRPVPDVKAAIDAAKQRLGAQGDGRRRDGTPREQLSLGD